MSRKYSYSQFFTSYSPIRAKEKTLYYRVSFFLYIIQLINGGFVQIRRKDLDCYFVHISGNFQA